MITQWKFADLPGAEARSATRPDNACGVPQPVSAARNCDRNWSAGSGYVTKAWLMRWDMSVIVIKRPRGTAAGLSKPMRQPKWTSSRGPPGSRGSGAKSPTRTTRDQAVRVPAGLETMRPPCAALRAQLRRSSGTPPGSPPGSSGVASIGAGGSGCAASGSSSAGSSGTGWLESITGSGSGKGATMEQVNRTSHRLWIRATGGGQRDDFARSPRSFRTPTRETWVWFQSGVNTDGHTTGSPADPCSAATSSRQTASR